MSKRIEWYSENFLERLEVIREQDAQQAETDRKNGQFLRKNHLLPKIAPQSEIVLPYRKYSDVFGERPAIGQDIIDMQLKDLQHLGSNIATLIDSKLHSEVYSDKPNPKLVRVMGRTLLHRNMGYIVSAERFESPDPRVQRHGLLAGTVLLGNGMLNNYCVGVNPSDVPADSGLEFNLPEQVVEYKIAKSASALSPITLGVGDRTYTEHFDNLVRFVDKHGLDTVF